MLTLSLLAFEAVLGGSAALAQINPNCTPLPYSGNNPDVTPNTLLDSDELPNSGSATELAYVRQVAGDNSLEPVSCSFGGGAKDGTWSAGGTVQYFLVKAAKVTQVFQPPGPASSGSWTTACMLTPNGKNQPDISHGNCYGGTGSASLTVTKAVLNGDGQTEFTFTGSSGLTISPLTRGARNTSMSTNPIALQPGTQYTISEDTPLETGWESQGVSCTIVNGGEQEIISSETTSITFAAEAGNEITCTFTNAFELDKNGFIKIVKELDPESEGAPANAEFDFTVKDDQNQEVANATLQVGNETTIAIDPGTYTVEEFDIPENWTLEDISCNGETLSNPASVEVQTGETVTCTFTNKLEEPDEGGEIRIEKRTDSENPPSGAEFSFTVDGEPAGTLLIDQGITIPVEAGERTILELTPPDGCTLADVDCGGGTPVDNGVVVTVVDGETVTCTFTNNFEREGTFIKIIKRLDSGSDDPKNGAQFNYNLDGSPAATLGIGEEILVPVEPGERTVEELTPPANWELTGINCGNDQNPATVDVPEGQTVTCTFTNRFNQPTGSLKVKKTTVGGDDNFRFSVSGQPSFSLRNGQQKTFWAAPLRRVHVD